MLGLVIFLNLIMSLLHYIMDGRTGIPADVRHLADFQSGFMLGLAIVSLFMLMKYRKLLRDERGLRESFNKETDERMILIRSKAGMPALLITSVIMIFAGIIAGYFNIIIFYTLLAAGICQLLLGSGLKFYYMHCEGEERGRVQPHSSSFTFPFLFTHDLYCLYRRTVGYEIPGSLFPF